jgi:nitrile hydratase subunit beta
MDGIHDMGGMDGFGKVDAEPNEPVFHEIWEARVLAMSRAIGALGIWNIDQGRHAIELLAPHVYLRSSYYERWLLRLERMLVAHGLIDVDEIAAGHAMRPGKTMDCGTFTVAAVKRVVQRGAFLRQEAAAARFKPRDRVRALNIHPRSHTRLPRYARGQVGIVERLHGAHVFPDATVLGNGEDPQWLYTVCFEGRDLWGADADPSVKVSIDAFEPYLEPA